MYCFPSRTQSSWVSCCDPVSKNLTHLPTWIWVYMDEGADWLLAVKSGSVHFAKGEEKQLPCWKSAMV